MIADVVGYASRTQSPLGQRVLFVKRTPVTCVNDNDNFRFVDKWMKFLREVGGRRMTDGVWRLDRVLLRMTFRPRNDEAS